MQKAECPTKKKQIKFQILLENLFLEKSVFFLLRNPSGTKANFLPLTSNIRRMKKLSIVNKSTPKNGSKPEISSSYNYESGNHT